MGFEHASHDLDSDMQVLYIFYKIEQLLLKSNFSQFIEKYNLVSPYIYIFINITSHQHMNLHKMAL